MILIKEIGLKGKTKSKYGLFKCDCGKEFETQISRVKGGFTKSCGCLKNKKSSDRMKKMNIKHNGTGTRIYNIWIAMQRRCSNHKNYKNIEICSEWEDFNKFRKWSLENGYEDNLTIDREDTFGDYEPSNCRWVTMEIQAQNRRKKEDKQYTSKFKGVYFDKKSKQYRASITVCGNRFNLGLFDNEEDAKNQYNKFILNNNLKHMLN